MIFFKFSSRFVDFMFHDPFIGQLAQLFDDNNRVRLASSTICIARAVGGTPESWLCMQKALDLWAAEMKFKSNSKIAPRALGA
ncbi:MAG: hypothetical protein WAO82_08415 [Limnohabitans sp.]|jgi:plasmid maintenance system antidote protein VapI